MLQASILCWIQGKVQLGLLRALQLQNFEAFRQSEPSSGDKAPSLPNRLHLAQSYVYYCLVPVRTPIWSAVLEVPLSGLCTFVKPGSSILDPVYQKPDLCRTHLNTTKKRKVSSEFWRAPALLHVKHFMKAFYLIYLTLNMYVHTYIYMCIFYVHRHYMYTCVVFMYTYVFICACKYMYTHVYVCINRCL